MIRAFAAADTDQVVALWHAAGLTRPWNDPHKDIERKLSTQPDLFLVIARDGDILATVMIGYDGHRGWVYYLAVAESERGHGHARALMDEAERRLIALGCPKLMLMVREDNAAVIELYEHLGYTLESTRVIGKRLIPDAPSAG